MESGGRPKRCPTPSPPPLLFARLVLLFLFWSMGVKRKEHKQTDPSWLNSRGRGSGRDVYDVPRPPPPDDPKKKNAAQKKQKNIVITRRGPAQPQHRAHSARP
jgi:hypothetical protein